jgi:hypothetical protein
MLFMFDRPVKMEMVMKDMNFPLDFIFIDENWEVRQINSAEKNSKDKISPIAPIHMVLEVNKGVAKKLGITTNMTLEASDMLKTQFNGCKKYKSGGKFEMIGDTVYKVKVDDVPAHKGKMQLLDEGGTVVANVENGARIFSRKHTEELINLFKQKDIKKLGDTLVQIIAIQETQKPDYVEK